MIRVLILAAALTLAACATTGAPPPYAAAASSNSLGYSETQIESTRYFVSYRAPNGAEAARLEDYALLRAAELTLESGREWFWVDRRTLDQQADGRANGPRIGVGVGGATFGRHSGSSVGVGVTFPLGNSRSARPIARGATLEVRFGDGPKPDAPNAYNARETSMNLRARIASGE